MFWNWYTHGKVKHDFPGITQGKITQCGIPTVKITQVNITPGNIIQSMTNLGEVTQVKLLSVELPLVKSVRVCFLRAR